MAYFELSFSVPADVEFCEILSARLEEMGCDSFWQEESVLKAYIDAVSLDMVKVNALIAEPFFAKVELISAAPLPEENWNAKWESNYLPVIIDQRCRIRAPFHEPDPAFAFDLLIEPRMSFGTAHHETTAQMIAFLLDLELKGKKTLDMGSGTAVLAILAAKKGADPVWAVDNDEWAYNNARDNVVLNHTPGIHVVLGDAEAIKNTTFDVIIANITRNILLEDMHIYREALNANGLLLMSGFYEKDLPLIQKKAESLGLKYKKHTTSNQWVAVVFSS
jgi:ribosomal protein L11 methyltransferase